MSSKSYLSIFLYKSNLHLLNYNKFVSYIMAVLDYKNKLWQKINNYLKISTKSKFYNYNFVSLNDLAMISIDIIYY